MQSEELREATESTSRPSIAPIKSILLSKLQVDQQGDEFFVHPWTRQTLPAKSTVRELLRMKRQRHSGDHKHFVHGKFNTHAFPDIGVLVKLGLRPRILQEAITLRALNIYYDEVDHPVPVPKVYGVLVDGEEALLYQQLMPGNMLLDVWPRIDTLSRDQICAQLREIIAILRALPSPTSSPFIGSIVYGQIPDWIFSRNLACGPFDSMASFNDHFTMTKHSRFLDRMSPSRALLKDDWPVDMVFTHGDLHRSNILVDQDENGEWHVTAVLDFEHAGFMPSYWEHSKSRFYRSEIALEDYANKIVDPCSSEIAHAFAFHTHSVT